MQDWLMGTDNHQQIIVYEELLNSLYPESDNLLCLFMVSSLMRSLHLEVTFLECWVTPEQIQNDALRIIFDIMDHIQLHWKLSRDVIDIVDECPSDYARSFRSGRRHGRTPSTR